MGQWFSAFFRWIKIRFGRGKGRQHQSAQPPTPETREGVGTPCGARRSDPAQQGAGKARFPGGRRGAESRDGQARRGLAGGARAQRREEEGRRRQRGLGGGSGEGRGARASRTPGAPGPPELGQRRGGRGLGRAGSPGPGVAAVAGSRDRLSTWGPRAVPLPDRARA